MMLLDSASLISLWLTFKLATVVTLLLLLLSMPLAWWLARTDSRWKPLVETVVALPIVLPPSVLGFYLLLAMGPDGPVGRITQGFGLGTLPFSFWGLVVGSLIYSLPFVVQPLQNAFSGIPSALLEAAATLRAGPWDSFVNLTLPMARRGLLTAIVMGFAHTVGEFGVVLMVGGNIAGETRVVSIMLYDQVEALDYAVAHQLALLLLVFSFTVLLLLYLFNRRHDPLGALR